MPRDALVAHLDALLDPERMEDSGPNGLQVEGKREVKTIVGAVTASRRVIRAAAERGADALIVHHGLFWRSMGTPRLTGWLGERVRLLMRHDMNLIQYHLPLDRHPQVGNNAQLLLALALKPTGSFGEHELGRYGDYRKPVPVTQVLKEIESAVGARPVHIAGGPAEIERVGVVSGAGQRYLEDAIAADCDLFLTGEASEFVTHVARESGIHYAWAGHHATERLGVKAVLAHLEEKFPVEATFEDEENPV